VKLCRSCQQIKPRRFFHARASKRDGLNSYCIPCACAKSREYRAANLESVKATQAAWYVEHRDEHAARCARWRGTNRLRHRQLARQAYERNRPAYIARAAAWNAAHPEQRRERTRRRRARLAAVTVERVDYAAILAEHGPVCHICDGLIEPDDLHFDHVIPIARGGAHVAGNVRPSHARCNLVKGTRLMAELRRGGAAAA
jgi:5-methylcytosine-specific restriction endonuclease McrA